MTKVQSNHGRGVFLRYVSYMNRPSSQKSMSTEDAQHLSRSCNESIDFLGETEVSGTCSRKPRRAAFLNAYPDRTESFLGQQQPGKRAWNEDIVLFEGLPRGFHVN